MPKPAAKILWTKNCVRCESDGRRQAIARSRRRSTALKESSMGPPARNSQHTIPTAWKLKKLTVEKARKRLKSCSWRWTEGRRISSGGRASSRNGRTRQTRRLGRVTTWPRTGSKKQGRLGGARKIHTSRCPTTRQKHIASMIWSRRWRVSYPNTCWRKKQLKSKRRVPEEGGCGH